MKIKDNLLWWASLTGLVVFWIIFGVIQVIDGNIILAVASVIGLATVVLQARTNAVQQARIRYLKISIASLERALKEAHRRDR